jgi:hypothetical protein
MQIWMPREVDPDQVVRFAFVPVGDGPDPRDRRNFRNLAGLAPLPARQFHFDDQIMAMRITVKVVDHFDVRFVAEFRSLFRVRLEIIDAAQVVEGIKRESRFRFQIGGNLGDRGRSHFHPGIHRVKGSPGDLIAEFRDQSLVDLCCCHAIRHERP